MKKQTYRPRTLAGATREVRQLRKQNEAHRRWIEILAHHRHLLAKLAATTPQFDNPLEAMRAQNIRDQVLMSKAWMPPEAKGAA